MYYSSDYKKLRRYEAKFKKMRDDFVKEACAAFAFLLTILVFRWFSSLGAI